VLDHTLKIADIELDNNVILAPMSGVSDAPFRLICKRFGAGMVVSEMVACEAMIRDNVVSAYVSLCFVFFEKMIGHDS